MEMTEAVIRTDEVWPEGQTHVKDVKPSETGIGRGFNNSLKLLVARCRHCREQASAKMVCFEYEGHSIAACLVIEQRSLMPSVLMNGKHPFSMKR